MTSPMTPPHAAPGQQTPVTAPPQSGAGYGPPAPPSGASFQGQPPQGQPLQGQPLQGQPLQAGPPAAPGQHAAPGYAPWHQTNQGYPQGQPLGQQAPPPHGAQQAPWATSSAQPRALDTNAKTRRLAGWAVIAGAGLVILGSVLPWASVAFVGSVHGTDGDGVITLVCAVIAALLALPAALGKRLNWLLGIAAFFGLLSAGIGAYDLSNISALASDESLVSVGPGLPIIIVGGLVVVGASIFGLIKGKRG